jgi:hypothetical protein
VEEFGSSHACIIMRGEMVYHISGYYYKEKKYYGDQDKKNSSVHGWIF